MNYDEALRKLPADGGVFESLNLNLYGYVHQKPLMLTDPSGNCPVCVVVVAGAFFGGWEYANAPGPDDELYQRGDLGVIGGTITGATAVTGANASIKGIISAVKAKMGPKVGTALVPKPHGNSKANAESQVLYALIDKSDGSLQKIGITSQRTYNNRYTDRKLNSKNVVMVPVMYLPNRAIALGAEAAAVGAYFGVHGELPPQQINF